MDWIGLDPWVDGLDWVSKNGPMSNSVLPQYSHHVPQFDVSVPEKLLMVVAVRGQTEVFRFRDGSEHPPPFRKLIMSSVIVTLNTTRHIPSHSQQCQLPFIFYRWSPSHHYTLCLQSKSNLMKHASIAWSFQLSQSIVAKHTKNSAGVINHNS